MLGFPFWIYGHAFLFAGLCSEVGSTLTVLRVFTRENDIVTIGSENLFQSVHVKLLSCVDKFISSLLGSVEHLAFTPADTTVALAADCCLATIACADKKRNRPGIATAAGRILRLSFRRTRFISCSQLFFTMNAAYLRRPLPPGPPPPRKPPLRDPMLEAPQLLFARALDPLYP